MNHPYIDYPFTKCLNEIMKEKKFSQERLGALVRTSREHVNRVCSGAEEPSLKFIGAAAYVFCLSPYDVRMFFSDAGFDLDSKNPKMVKARAILDVSHTIDDYEILQEKLDALAMFGLAPYDRDVN